MYLVWGGVKPKSADTLLIGGMSIQLLAEAVLFTSVGTAECTKAAD